MNLACINAQQLSSGTCCNVSSSVPTMGDKYDLWWM
jgi:hypothetical protein